MAQRQQRRNNARGLVAQVNQRPVPDITWQITNVVGNAVVLTPTLDYADLLAYGIPQLRQLGPNVLPVGVTKITSAFLIEYATTVVLPVLFELPYLDPAIRNGQGAYLAAATVDIGVPGPPAAVIPKTTLNFSAVAGNDLILTTTLPVTADVFIAVKQFINETQVVSSTGADFTAATVTVHFAAPPVSGDQITYAGTDLASFGGAWVCADAGAWLIP